VNIFTEKFQKKSNSDLQYILDNKDNYNEQAVSASIQILKERNGVSSEIEAVESEIKLKKGFMTN